MLFGGALDGLVPGAEQQLDFWLVVLAGTVGNVVGSWLAYWAGYSGGPARRPMGPLPVDPPARGGPRPRVVRAPGPERRLRRAPAPGRTFISLPAGVVRMGFWRFTFYTVLGCPGAWR